MAAAASLPRFVLPDRSEHDERGRIHRAVSDDGTEIAGRVHGQGPPLVLVPGVMMDGETIWEPLLPLLTDRFTCFALSTRGRGPSGQATEFSVERLKQDITSFIDDIGEPVYLVGWSQGALLSLGVTEQTAAVAAVAPFEPPVFDVAGEEVLEQTMRTVSRQGELAAEGRFADAARVFIEDLVTNEDEREALPEPFYEVLAPNIPTHLQEMQAFASRAPDQPSATDPAELAKITVPVLVLYGTRSVPRASAGRAVLLAEVPRSQRDRIEPDPVVMVGRLDGLVAAEVLP